MKRLKLLGMPVSLATIILLVIASRSPADAPAEGPAPARVQGVIKITRFQGRDILEATLTSPEGTVYQLVLDEKGEDLAKVMFGQGVKVVGQVSQKEGKQLLKVLGLQEEGDTAAYELWRRSRCNACAVENGMKHSVAPKELHGAVPITGRLFPLGDDVAEVSDKALSWVRCHVVLWK